MAFYDIARSQVLPRPADNVWRARAATDTHLINQANLRKAEIEEPYIKTLLEQKVRRGEQEIARSDQQMEVTDLAIEAQGIELKQAQRQESFQNEMANGMPREELRKKYPLLEKQLYSNEIATNTQALGLFEENIKYLYSLPEDQRAGAWNEILSTAPEEMRNALGEYAPEKLREIRYNVLSTQRSMMSEMLDRLDYYEAVGDKEMVKLIKQMLTTKYASTGSGTQRERAAQSMFGWAPNPMAAMDRYERIDRRLRVAAESATKEAITGVSSTDEMFDRISIYQLMSDPETREEATMRLQQFYLDAIAALDEGDREWYLDARRRLDEQTEAIAKPPEEQEPAGDAPLIQTMTEQGMPAEAAEQIIKGLREAGRVVSEANIWAAYDYLQNQ